MTSLPLENQQKLIQKLKDAITEKNLKQKKYLNERVSEINNYTDKKICKSFDKFHKKITNYLDEIHDLKKKIQTKPQEILPEKSQHIGREKKMKKTKQGGYVYRATRKNKMVSSTQLPLFSRRRNSRYPSSRRTNKYGGKRTKKYR